METSINPDLVGAVFLKYMAIQPPEIFVQQIANSQPIKLWFCQSSGAPSMGSGRLSEVPIDTHVAYVYSDPSWVDYINAGKYDQDELNSILESAASQLISQYNDLIIDTKSKAYKFIQELVEADPELYEIATTYFRPSKISLH